MQNYSQCTNFLEERKVGNTRNIFSFGLNLWSLDLFDFQMGLYLSKDPTFDLSKSQPITPRIVLFPLKRGQASCTKMAFMAIGKVEDLCLQSRAF